MSEKRTTIILSVEQGSNISLTENGTILKNVKTFYLPCSNTLPERLRAKYLVSSENVADLVLEPTMQVYIRDFEPVRKRVRRYRNGETIKALRVYKFLKQNL